MEFTLSSKALCSENVIFIEQKGRLPLDFSLEKSGTFMCLINSLLSTPSPKGKGHYRDKNLLVKSLFKTRLTTLVQLA